MASNRTVRLVAGGELAVELVENGVHVGVGWRMVGWKRWVVDGKMKRIRWIVEV